jgi:hypothetical protein
MNYRALTVILATALVAACDENPSEQEHGALELTTSAATAEKAFASVDGWNVKFDRFLVHVSAVNVMDLEGVITASATPQIIDQVAAGPKTLVSATNRKARAWEDVNFQIGPALPDVETTVIEPVTEADREMMVKDQLTFYVEGSATRADVTKTFKWAFKTDTTYKDCRGERDGQMVHGMVVPPNGADSAEIGMRADVLLSDDLAAAGTSLRFDAMAEADADKDGIVTLEELEAVSLEDLRAANRGPYATGDNAEIANLRAFTEELTRHVVTSFRAKGSCTAEVTPATP